MSNNVGFFGTKVGAWCNKQTAPPISLVFMEPRHTGNVCFTTQD